MNQSIVSSSKFLSLILRHQPEAIGMQLDDEGWLAIDELIVNANLRGKKISLEIIHEVVATNDKKRFSLSDDGLRIRANQGHSIANIELNLQRVQPPEFLFHGTVAAFMEPIRKDGLQKRSRNHVHLSSDESTAIKVAQRRGKPVILTVEAARMSAAGFEFFLSENGVWLTNDVPVSFIRFE